MGLLSLFSSRKGNDPAPERARRQRNDPGAGIASSRRLADEYADDTLDPEFPQKQRARRRLIGAVVLVVAAVIVLPIVFETKPRPVADDVAVKVSGGQGSSKPRVEPRKADPLPPAPAARSDAAALDAGEEIVNTADKPADKPIQRAEAKPDAKPEAKPQGSGKYLILIGAFSSEEKAKTWLAKLKASKVPAYVEKKALADGERILLRAGPFSDRDAADAADKRVRAAGLTSKVIEQ
ncbi:sporulation protein [Cupriavidus sp. TA19]|uniref:SPOR domain-containing protein n=1 Tax=unclassified Cupriavidus TaxID=2640874 RepID=UPI000E2F3B7C|nr:MULTISPECIES: SPOR domain-containing protein [unclassified Cupriavidus]BDB24913.1 SPOR domain-containing protein [Cupriavidus sp. P-10]GLC93548.1 sporulation protein [Cupriavidus sp. TA19]